jgi:arylsulfatase A-like enzyme
MLTGLYPAEHGADEHTKVLATAQLTLAEILREEGHLTMAISSGLFVTKASGMHQGFEVFDESLAGGQKVVSSVGVTDRAIELLQERGDRPFFLFVHYFDPHWVYQDHGDWEFADGYDGWLVAPSQDLTQEAFEKMVRTERPRPGEKWLDPEEIEYLADLYDGEIAFTDREVGRLLRYLRDSGLEKDTLVIVVGDHGEEFMERGYLGHGKTLNQEVLAVPLAMAGPSITGGSVCPWKVETRALLTTILDSLGLPPPSGDGLPRPLLPLEDVGDELVRSATYTKAMRAGSERFARPQRVWMSCIQDGRWKLMEEHLSNSTILYDLEEDPRETRDASDEHPIERERLARALEELDSRVRGRETRKLAPRVDEEHERQLRALGYL